MTDPIDFSKRKREKAVENRINKKFAIEALDAMKGTIEKMEDDEEIDLFLCSFLTSDGGSIESCGINVGDELRALGLVARWDHMINYFYDES